ncbi:TonB-dependent receptor domain-containing protein [Campylobacter sp.]|uniref:TonB-dependent receptor domain-containing protein n=1 Tax=Campylobacter sp. TaxID=205 RepID=UPI0026FEA39B|nr:TonB-dependent receptor [Campylobacter sp.]
MRVVLSCTALASLLFANGANPDNIAPIKEFAPPKPYTPNIAQSAFPKHQFERTNRDDYFFVTDLLDDSMDKFHISGGFYGRDFYSSTLFKYRGANFYTILNANFSKGNRYKDGSGKEVDFGYSRQGQSAIVGFVPNDMSEFRFTFLRDNIDNEKEPHNPTDAVKTERKIAKFNARLGEESLANTLNLELMLRDIKRNANNYELRSSPQKVKVDVDRKIFDAKLSYDADIGKFHNMIGASYQRDTHSGKRYGFQGGKWVFNGYRFGDVKNQSVRVFDDISYKFNKSNKLNLALNYEWMNSNLRALNNSYSSPMPQISTIKGLVKSVYGENLDGDIKHKALSASLKYEFKPNEEDICYAALESISRMPSNMERFNTLYGPLDNGWISNPFLKPERHNRINLGLEYKSEFFKEYLSSKQNEDSFAIKAHLIASKVKDLIIYDRRHSKMPMPMNKNAVISRNVDAEVYSANLSASYNFLRNFGLKAALFYNYGQNKTDGRALYQIRPFEANLAADYRSYAGFGSFSLGSALKYVAKQNRGDFDKNSGLGIDNKGVKAFALVDIYGAVEFRNKFGLRFGVNNIFDKEYAEFISGDHVAALNPRRVNAPGRTVFVSFHSSF